MHYRQDIDGLRALAVSLVVIFHTNEALIPGGFIGVDIFFVISGYLITGLILRDIDAGQFSFVEFYRRRTKRILPAMFLVTFSTLCVGAWLMLPSDVLDLSQSAITTAAMLSNAYFTFELDTGYFAADSRTIPLLHMWSLAVEEQFYLFWPILLVVLAKTRLNLLPILAGLVLVSVIVGEWMLREGWHSFAYYMLPSRVFQFALGGALVLVERKRWATLGSGWAFWVSLAGLLLVLASAFGLDGETAFPGLWAAPVTIGATLLLWGGRAPHALSKLFSLSPLRWIGLISFSLYLWHWPVLAFQRYLYPELGLAQQVFSIAVMLGLSVLSYRLIEQP
ncbi:MAG: acyltransferase, partial [Pseudomonadota bacterium]